jgi:hypothetical protein
LSYLTVISFAHEKRAGVSWPLNADGHDGIHNASPDEGKKRSGSLSHRYGVGEGGSYQ